MDRGARRDFMAATAVAAVCPLPAFAEASADIPRDR